MKFLVAVALALLMLTLESVLVQRMGLAISRIDVTVVLIAFLALRATTLEGAVTSYSVGYLLDLMSGQPTGLYTFLGVFVFLIARLILNFVDVRTAASFVLFAVGADALHGLLAAVFTWLTAKDGSSSAMLSAMPLQLLLTGLAAFLLFPLLRRIEAKSERPASGLLR